MTQPFQSVLVGISTNLPASRHAQEQLQRAANAGFKWPNAEMVIGKIEEELREVREAEDENNKEHLTEEVGDLLHAIHTLAVFYNIDAASALEQSLPDNTATIEEKMASMRFAASTQNATLVHVAIGSLLQSVHAFAQKNDILCDTALESTNHKFAHRFTRMEAKLQGEGSSIADTIASKGLKHLVVNYWNTEKAGAER